MIYEWKERKYEGRRKCGVCSIGLKGREARLRPFKERRGGKSSEKSSGDFGAARRTRRAGKQGIGGGTQFTEI